MLRPVLPTVCLTLLASVACAQTAWDFSAGNGSPASLSANLTGGTIAAVNSALAFNNTSASGTYSGASGGNNAALTCAPGTLSTATSTYLEFTVTPITGASLSATALTLGTRSTSTGPTTLTLFTSANGYASAVGSAAVSANSAWSVASFSPLAITGATSGSLTFRIYGSGGAGSGTSGNWRVDDVSLTIAARVPPPVILTQPAAQTLNSGQPASLTVVASGTGVLTYQWRFNGTALAGATSATLSLGAVTTAAAGGYDVVVADSFANRTTSSAATLTVNRLPTTITLSSLSAIYDGSPHPATAVSNPAGATIAIVYQGSGGTAYPLGPTPPTAMGTYLATATITDSEHQGSASGNLTISGPSDWFAPAVSAAPASQTVLVGDAVTLAISAAGKPVPTLQWRKGGVAIAGATAATFTIGASSLADAGSYDVVLANAMGTTTSAAAWLTVEKRAQTIAFDAPAGVYAAGTGVKLSATSSSGLPVAFTILTGSASLAGATLTGLGQSVVVRAIQPGDSTTYLAAPPVDRTLTFVVGLAAPFLTSTPVDQAVNAGATVTFAAAAIGTPAPTWQWSKDGVAIVGATGPSLTLAQVASSAVGRYTVTATNPAGAASASAQLFLSAENPPASATALTTSPAKAPASLERLTNLSARSRAAPGLPLTIGFVVSGTARKQVLVRGIGPSLAEFGVTDALADPQLALLRGGALIKANDDWFRDPDAALIRAAAAGAGAFALGANSLDAAIIGNLEPGAYTVQVSSGGGEGGQVLAEVYEVP